MTDFQQTLRKLHTRLRHTIMGPHLLAFVPAAALAAYWIGGEPVLIIVALAAPLLLLLARSPQQSTPASANESVRDHISRSELEDYAAQTILRAVAANLSTAIYLARIDGLNEVQQRSGPEAVDLLQTLTLNRLRKICKAEDHVFRISDNCYAICLSPSLRLDLDSMMQLANRLQSGIEDPAQYDDETHSLKASIGFCASAKIPNCCGKKLLSAAESALGEAISHGPSAIRAWSEGIGQTSVARRTLLNDIQRAIANGQIQPWFQPQLCTSTGKVSGMEALARWVHPERGIIPPGEFLTILEQAGLMERLSEAMFQQSLAALQSWDHAGIHVPRVSVNFSASELRNPRLVDRLKWELDRFEIPANRLGVEILETVIADSPKGITVHNITELGKIGCNIDLDDFGTGHASITTLRRFKVHRLKIDRSFVTRIDRDEDQRCMFAAVLGLADRLGLETLAEGVETAEEHALLAQLGCAHVQGFSISRPMPASQVADWVKNHDACVPSTPWQGRNMG